MRKYNSDKLCKTFTELGVKSFLKEISYKELKETFKKNGQFLSPNLIKGAEKANLLTNPRRGYYVINNVSSERVEKAIEYTTQFRRVELKKHNSIKAFNIEVEVDKKDSDFTVDGCIAFLERKGYFIYKKAKNEEIHVIKVFK